MLIKKREQQILKVGVLLPNSRQYPGAAGYFLNGMRLYFTVHENQFERGKAELLIEEVGVATESICIEKAHKLLSTDQAIILTGLIEPLIGVEVAKMTCMAGCPTMLSTLGEAAVPPDKITKNLYYNTLQYWQSYFYLGRYMAENTTKEFEIITSFYDCGYDPLRAFRMGIISAGGQIRNEIILKTENLEELNGEVKERIQFHDEYEYALILHPKLLNWFIKNFDGGLKNAVITPFSNYANGNKKFWAFPDWKNSSPNSTIFQRSCLEYFDEEANEFYLLGYQQGQLIYRALQSLNDPARDEQTILDTWSNFREDMVVAGASFDQGNHHLNFPLSIFYGAGMKDENLCIKESHHHFRPADGYEDIFNSRNAFTNPYMFY
ncbi:hypothetical protein [Fulvivirga ligni]|uniref:hypothetical protein n=1 Tax=Fulvivirga ligni TaxID=2904246 RepID=UPI001F21CD7F|nr:hypothetical protein [Fulvivirga ligni]UII19079.1 hypothetical protein LVD16_14640 [Fulvivirga ligni]